MSTPARPEGDGPPPDGDRILAEAVGWHAALASDDADWDGYVAWLEADVRHRDAYDAVALVDAAVDRHADALGTLLVDPGRRDPDDGSNAVRRLARRWAVGGLAAAAAAIAAIAVAPQLRPAPDVEYRSGGEVRHVALAAGVQADLAPRSTLVALGGDPTRLSMRGGEAYFDVAHDPTRSLSIRAGETSIRDVGTVFSVNVAPGFVTVAVAEGSVGVGPTGGDETTVPAGRRYALDRSTGAARIGPAAASSVATWRSGRLTYSDAPLPVVAADIARYSGAKVDVDPALAERRFSGTLTIGDGKGLAGKVAGIMAIRAERADGGVRLAPPPGR